MRPCRRKTRLFIMVLLMLSASFLLYLTSYTLSYPLYNKHLDFNIKISNSLRDRLKSLHNIEYISLMAVRTEEESGFQPDLLPLHSIYLKLTRSFFNDFFYSYAHPQFIMCLILCTILLFFKKFGRYISVIAIPIGGHAPPAVFRQLCACGPKFAGYEKTWLLV
jgi:hypothetical protein